MWACVCGQHWHKVKHPRTLTTCWPVCFYCGGRTIKQGFNYVCTECGKSRRVYIRDKDLVINENK